MKALSIFLILMSGLEVHANTVFRLNTLLPKELQKRVLKTVDERCGKGEIKNFTLSEVETTLVIDEVDFGVRDRYYTTDLSATTWFQQHPVTYRIQVRSGEWAIDNPSVEKYEILALTSDQGVCN